MGGGRTEINKVAIEIVVDEFLRVLDDLEEVMREGAQWVHPALLNEEEGVFQLMEHSLNRRALRTFWLIL